MIHQPRNVGLGDRGADVYAYKRALHRFESKTPQSDTLISWPAHNHIFGRNVEKAVRRFQEAHHLQTTGRINEKTYDALRWWIDDFGQLLLRRYNRKHRTLTSSYPLSEHGTIIQRPYEGTHLLFGNWESDNAIDITIDAGTPVLAVAAGTIGSQIGPLDASNPVLAGSRVHLFTAVDELYYAHLRTLDVVAGERVQAGQRLGLSGIANGVSHLHFACKTGDPGLKYADSPSPGYRDRHLPG